MKKASDNIRLFLHSAEMGDGLHLHALFGQVLEFSHDSGFEVSPNPFVRIELGRVAGQQVKRNLPVEGFHESPDLLRLVRGVTVNDQEDPALAAMNQAFDELNELVGTNRFLEVSGISSNARFRQLIRSGTSQTEVMLYSNAKGMRPPDNILTGDNALVKGECGFAFVENLDPKDPIPRPIALTPFVPGTDRFDPLPFDGKAVVLWTDGSVKSMPIERATGEVMLDGTSLLDPAHPVWSGRAPSITFPE